MNPIHSSMRVQAMLETRDKDRALAIPELENFARISDSRLIVDMNETGPAEVASALERHEVRVARYWLTICYQSDSGLALWPEPVFWEDPPDDCAGAILSGDGYVDTPRRKNPAQLTPASDPFYITTRPEFDAEHARSTIHLIHADGLLLVADGLLAWLTSIGAEGDTAPVIYRGHNNWAYDTVQPGFKRFYPRPTHDMPVIFHGYPDIDFLPEAVPADFTCCGMLSHSVDFRGDKHADYKMVVGKSLLRQLHLNYPLMPLEPVFRWRGTTHQWVTEFDKAMQRLGSALPVANPSS
jgi:hypothetical protein